MERLMRRLNGSLSRSVRRSIQDVFQQSPLDLRFALQKTLDPRITFSRASSGTYVDSQGVLRTATTNLILRSEKLDETAAPAQWLVTGSGATITAATDIAAPNGTMTAWTLTSSGAAAQLQQTITGINGATYTGSFWIRRRSGTGTVNIRVAENTNTALTGVTSNWQRFSFTVISTSTTIRLGINLSGTADAVDLWGAQLEQSSTVGEYVPSNTTFTSRASNATFYNSGGIIETAGVNVARDRAFLPDENGVMRSAGRLLLEPAATNLITYSEDFSNAAWSTSSTAVTTNTTTAPDGTTTADSLLETTAHLDHVLYATSPQTFTTATHSIYVKPNGRNNVLLRFYHAPNDWISSVFSLTGNGSVTQTSAGSSSAFTAVSRSIVNVGNGWYRVSMTATQSSRATFAAVVDLCTSSTPTLSAGNGSEAYTGDSTKGVYLWGAQFETGTVATSYIPTVASQVTRSADVSSSTANSAPRFDHNPTTGESLGLLVEESRTNLLVRSEDLATTWLTFGTTVSANAATAPDGTATADKLVNTTANAEHGIYQATTTSGSNTFTVFAKQAELRYLVLRRDNLPLIAVYDLQTGTVSQTEAGVTASITAFGNGWYRCSMTCSSTGNTVIKLSDVGTGVVYNSTYAGIAGQGIFLWGAQLEAGAFPTSYIPTTTAAATRSADVASITGTAFSSWYRQDEGTIFTSGITPPNRSNFPSLNTMHDGTSNNRIGQYVFTNGYYSTTRVGNVSQGDNTAAVTPTDGSSYQIASAFAVNNSVTAVNGVMGSVDTLCLMPTALNALAIGAGWNNANPVNSTIRRLTYFPVRLPNTTLQQITQ